MQHVTVHLADSLPKSVIERVDQMIKTMPDRERAIERRKQLHSWIDAGHGSCLLQRPEFAKIVQDAFLYFDNERYQLYAWVVMPNHFHVLFKSMNGWSLAKIVSSWKRFTATEIKKGLRGVRAQEANAEICDPGGISALSSCSGLEQGANAEIGDPEIANLRIGISEPLWHSEYWDRYIRNEQHFSATVEYIHQNPVKAGLCSHTAKWPWCNSSTA
jgi:REP element-mobilizing transposase RayT